MKTATPTHTDDGNKKQKIALLAQANKLAEARELATELSLKTPHDPEVWFLLGAIHGELKEFIEAERCCKKALVIAPEHPVLNFNMGVALRGQGKTADAIPFLETALRTQPDYLDACHELANALCLDKQYTRALEYYEKALELAPGSPHIHQNMGKALHELQRYDKAIHHYEISLSLHPDSVIALDGMAAALLATYKYAQAIDLLESAVQKLPEEASLHFKLAMAYQEQGDSESAMDHCIKTLALNENHADAKICIARIRGLQGNYKEAGTELHQLMEEYPNNVSAILVYSQFAHRLGEATTAVDLLKHELLKKEHADLTLARLEFSVGELLDQGGNPEAAFQHYEAGNKLCDAEFNYEGFKNYYRSIKDTFSAATMATLPRVNNTPPVTPVFIVGMPRSGTTLVEQILASHSNVVGGGELPYINNIVDNMSQLIDSSRPYPACLADLNMANASRLASIYLDHISEKSGDSAFVTDKLPSNFIHLGLISLLLPDAKIIHCIRNPRDTCLSCYFKNFSGAHLYAYNLADLGKYYRLYQDLMQHWKRTLQVPVHEIHYEALVHDQQAETKGLLEFCGLDWEDDCLNFHKTVRTVSTASHDQVRQPLYSKSINRWKQYEKHLGPLIENLEADI